MKIAPKRKEDGSKPIKLLTKTATTENKEDTGYRNKEITEGVTGYRLWAQLQCSMAD